LALGDYPVPAEAEIYRPRAGHVGQLAARHQIVAGSTASERYAAETRDTLITNWSTSMVSQSGTASGS